jgi:predicted dehydrogenase
MFKVAVAGCGAIAATHCEVLSKNNDVKIVAMADIDVARAAELCGLFGGNAYESLEQMLENEQIDVLHICTPHYLHVPMAIAAMDKGIHVLLEKPVATSFEELEQLKKAIKKSGKTLGVCLQNRYLPAAQKANELIKSGQAGAIKGARAFVTWRRDEEYYTKSGWRGLKDKECGGVMINQAIHTLDLMLWLVGEPRKIEGSIHNHHLKGIIEVEDTAEMLIDFGNDVRGVFYATNAFSCDSPVSLEIVCENRTILISGDELYINNQKSNTEMEGNINQKKHTEMAGNITGKDCWGAGHQLLIDDFYEKIASKQKFPIDIFEAERSIKAIFELYQEGEV